MKTNRLLFGALSACFAFSLLAAQSVRADDKPVMIVRKNKKGDAHKYLVKLAAEGMGVEIKVESKVTETIKEIKENGDVVIVSKDEGSKVSFAGMDIDQPAGPASTFTRSKQGKLVDWKIEKEDESFLSLKVQRLLDSLNVSMLPDKEVKQDDSWEVEFDNPVVEAKKFKIKTTYVGTEKVDGVELWKLKQKAEPIINADGDKLTYEQTVWLDPTNGSVVKSEQEAKGVPTTTQLGKLDWKIKIEAIKDEKKAEKSAIRLEEDK